MADVVIPMSIIAENSGSFTNVYGNTQTYNKALETEWKTALS
jgi:NADH dehydrogenase/NADH:ubiquinone oxidoreductase subunit G